VTLKEGRKLVLVVRETAAAPRPSQGAAAASENGAVILPPMPAFYTAPQTIGEIVDHTVARILDQFAIPHALSSRWGPQTTK
jgi:4-hydroxy-3-polyprenylbenzoate decarboxylase